MSYSSRAARCAARAFQTELKNSFSNYIKKRNIITEDLLLKCLEEIETPCERIAKDIFGIAEYEKLVIIDTENQELFLQRMKDILSESKKILDSTAWAALPLQKPPAIIE